VRAVMEAFGISFTSAKFQLWNALERKISLEAFAVNDTEPTDDWKGRESFTIDYFKPKDVPLSRAGRFAWYVVQALDKNLISLQSAASYLKCSEKELLANLAVIRGLFEL
jgi:hypothetical protein